MSQALLSTGLADDLGATYAGRLEPPHYDGRHDAGTGLVNGETIRSYSIDLANAVTPLIERRMFPLVLGGDCSILLGTMLALRRLGRYGLFFLDGHADLYLPDAEPSGEVASMELALLSGRGPRVLADIEGRGPLVHDDDIVAFGYRDEVRAGQEGSLDIRSTAIRPYGLGQSRIAGIGTATKEAVNHLMRDDLSGFWVHLDADVLNDDVMPSVDYRQPGGLSFSELSGILRTLIATNRAVGLTVTIYNPCLDPDGVAARGFKDSIVAGLSDQ